MGKRLHDNYLAVIDAWLPLAAVEGKPASAWFRAISYHPPIPGTLLEHVFVAVRITIEQRREANQPELWGKS